MASPVDIANLALAHLGDKAGVTSFEPPDGSAQAQHCARFYPMARDAMLEAHDWSFARKTTQLALLADNPTGWACAYALPADCLIARQVLRAGEVPVPRGRQPVRPLPWQLDGDAIYCDEPDARLRYTAPVLDPTRFSPLAVTALSWLLASYLAGPVIGGAEGATAAAEAYQRFATTMSAAAARDANQQQLVLDHAAPWVAVR